MKSVKISEMIGDQKKFVKLRSNLVDRKPTIIHGKPGTGKTSSVYALAEELGLKVLEVNASDERKKEDLQKILRTSRIPGFHKLIILLDEVDGLKNETIIERILDESVHSVVLTANEVFRIPEKIRKKCSEIKFYTPYISDVFKYVKGISKETGRDFNYSDVSEDVRSSIIAVLHGGEGYKDKNSFDLVTQIFKGEIPEKIDKDMYLWLICNAQNFYWGEDLFNAIQTIALADRTKQKLILLNLPKGQGKASYPSYLRKISSLKKEKTKLKKQRGRKKVAGSK